jgi:uncharacterized protein YjbI with pentapeptide repeats
VSNGWLIGTFVGLASIGLLGSGMFLCWGCWREGNGRQDLGIRLVTGAVVAIAVLALQVLFDRQLAHVEDRHQTEQAARNEAFQQQLARENLRLTLGVQNDLRNIDLSNRSLSSIYLGGKDLRSAKLVGAGLRGATLAGARLEQADLQGAHLEDAHLDNAYLDGAGLQWAHLQGAVFSGAKLSDADFTRADLRGADLRTAINPPEHRASFSQAEYDAHTKWPPGVSGPECPAKTNCWLS